MLDTNLWSRLGDADLGAPFYRAARAAGCEIVIPPSVLLEVARTPHPGARRRIVDAMLSGPRDQLPSEAELESREVVAEVKRLHPEWLRRYPDTAAMASLNAFWTKRLWRTARTNLDQLAAQVTADWRLDPAEGMLAVQRGNRQRFLESGINMTTLELWVEPMPEAPDSYLMGWIRGQRVEAWRMQGRDVFWHALSRVKSRSVLTKEDTTYADWVGAFVDLPAMTRDPVAFTRFWLDEVTMPAMPRIWLRWACDLAQFKSKVTDGNPYDAQHAAYLPDCDVFLTADRRYANALELVRKAAPTRIGNVARVPWPNGDLVKSIIEVATSVARQPMS